LKEGFDSGEGRLMRTEVGEEQKLRRTKGETKVEEEQ
jgi:hypothetical protein